MRDDATFLAPEAQRDMWRRAAWQLAVRFSCEQPEWMEPVLRVWLGRGPIPPRRKS